MKIVDVNSNTYINSSKEINDKNLQFKIGDIVRISKFSQKPTFQIEEVFLNTKIENIVLLVCYCVIMLLVILNAKKFMEHFTKKNCKKQIKKSLELKNNREKTR